MRKTSRIRAARSPSGLEGRRVAPRFFAVYAMPPLVGRTFTDDEERENGPGAAMISERFWARRFQRDPAAIGRALIVGGRSYPIVGVMPGDVHWHSDRHVAAGANRAWLLQPARRSLLSAASDGCAPGVSARRRARAGRGPGRPGQGVSQDAMPGGRRRCARSKSRASPTSRRGLVLVFGAVAALWIIAVANIAGLTLVQVHRRARELAIRTALGASRLRAIGTVVREGLLVAAIGGALGAGLASWLVAAMPALLIATPRINELTLDWRALAFVAATQPARRLRLQSRARARRHASRRPTA